MSTSVISLRVPSELKQRYDSLAERTGRTSTFYALRAMEEYVEDMEDAFAADAAYKEWQKDGAHTKTLAQVRTELGL